MEKKTFAQIVKDASFVEARVARQRALEQKRQEMELKKQEMEQKREEENQRKEKEQENRRIEKEKKDRERRENGESSERVRGFSIERMTKDWSEEDVETGLVGDKIGKRTAGSPAFAPPDSKTVKSSSSHNRSRSKSHKGGRGPGSH